MHSLIFFIDDLKDDVDLTKIYALDINKCRRNIILHNTDDYPVFTVLDKVEKYVKYENLKAGIYFVESNNYFPMRGSRWYHLPMVKYCLEKNIIKSSDIKFQVIAGVKLKADYFNKFIEFISKKLVNNKDMLKLAVNGMIGKFKPKPIENWTSICVEQNANDVFHHFLQSDGCFIKNRNINNKMYYHAYKKYVSEKDESESPIYHQILELEAIELYKLSKIIKSKKGTILDLNTDSISFVMKNNLLPFKVSSDGVNIKSYYFDDKKKIPKYKLEDKKGRLSISKLQDYKTDDKYILKNRIWKNTPDVENNDFSHLVDSIVDSETKKVKSCLVEGRAGTGKSYLVKQIQMKLHILNIKYITLGPTNVSCIGIDGITINRFINKVSKY